MNTNFNTLAHDVGLPELMKLSRHEILSDVITASIVGFSEGDLIVSHLEEYTGRKAELFGNFAYRDGIVAQRMGQAALANGLEQSEVYKFQDYTAELLYVSGSNYLGMAENSVIRIRPEFLVVDGVVVQTSRPISMVLEYGACLTSRSYARDQIAIAASGQPPFSYAPLARSHFMNQAIIISYDTTKHGPGLSRTFMDKGFYIGREDGPADATEAIIRSQQVLGEPLDVADLILSTNAHHSTEEHLKPAVQRAYRLLREDGMLIVRGLVKPDDGEIGIDAMTEWALQGGFDEHHTARLRAELDIVVSSISRGHTNDRETDIVVLTKR